VLIAFEDIIFIILGGDYRQGIEIFPIMVLNPIFLIISETTVYGISIAKKPIYDTIGIGISVVSNICFCLLLVPSLGLLGACISLSLSSFLMFLFRTIIAQRFYSSMINPKRTAFSLLLAIVLTVLATIFVYNFWVKLLISFVFGVIYLLIYHKELGEATSFIKAFINEKRGISKPQPEGLE